MPDDVTRSVPPACPDTQAWDDDGAAGAWIAPRLGAWGMVGAVVPTGFAAYARVPNMPVALADGEGFGSLLTGMGPTLSDPEQLDLLLGVLEPFTGDQECHFALWNGWGWLYDHETRAEDSRSFGLYSVSDGEATEAELAEAAEIAAAHRSKYQVERPAAPTLDLPHRKYHLWHGPLSSAGSFRSQSQTPTLWWPEDRSWFVGTEIDPIATEIGGTEAIIAAVLAVPELRGTRVSPVDPLLMPSDW